MPPIVGLFVSIAIFTVMFALGLGLKTSSFALPRHQLGVLARILIGTCLLVPLAGLLLLELPLTADLSRSARFAIALMVICPSAPLALRRVSSPGSSSALAARIQVLAAVVAIVSVPLMAELFRWVNPVDGWDITAADVALQVTRVQLVPLAAGLLLRSWKPGWAERWSPAINRLASALLLLVIVLLLVITSSNTITSSNKAEASRLIAGLQRSAQPGFQLLSNRPAASGTSCTRVTCSATSAAVMSQPSTGLTQRNSSAINGTETIATTAAKTWMRAASADELPGELTRRSASGALGQITIRAMANLADLERSAVRGNSNNRSPARGTSRQVPIRIRASTPS